MAQTPKRPPPEDQTTVWRFIDFVDRFSAKLDKPPQFLRLALNAWDGAGGQVLQCHKLLRRDKDYFLLKGFMCELLEYAGNTHLRYQGLLMNCRNEPATLGDVGDWLGFSGRGAYSKAKAVIGKLIKAGFLEAVPWEVAEYNQKQDSDTLQPKQVTTSKTGKQQKKKTASRAKKAGSSFKREKEQEQKEKKENKEGRQSQNRQPRERLSPKEFERVRQDQLRRLEECESQTQATIKAPSSPTATPPMSPTTPTDSDAGGLPEQCSVPPVSLSHTRRPGPSQGHTGTVLKLSEFRYTQESWAFADQVLRVLCYLPPDQSDHAAQRANFAKAYHDLAAEGFSGMSMAWFETEFLRRMGPVGDNRQARDNPESYARKSLDNLASNLRKRAGPNRATGRQQVNN